MDLARPIEDIINMHEISFLDTNIGLVTSISTNNEELFGNVAEDVLNIENFTGFLKKPDTYVTLDIFKEMLSKVDQIKKWQRGCCSFLKELRDASTELIDVAAERVYANESSALDFVDECWNRCYTHNKTHNSQADIQIIAAGIQESLRGYSPAIISGDGDIWQIGICACEILKASDPNFAKLLQENPINFFYIDWKLRNCFWEYNSDPAIENKEYGLQKTKEYLHRQHPKIWQAMEEMKRKQEFQFEDD